MSICNHDFRHVILNYFYSKKSSFQQYNIQFLSKRIPNSKPSLNNYLASVLYALMSLNNNAFVLLQNNSPWETLILCWPPSERCWQHFMRDSVNLNRERAGEERKSRVKLFAFQSLIRSKQLEILYTPNGSGLCPTSGFGWTMAAHIQWYAWRSGVQRSLMATKKFLANPQ